eukprot:CAMPEP_0115234654 /NCGR_PEP_ID=MMETSP0270-20121206/34904_1 /TAXON_ID=71861 /ORGANISM="Scrippsiella trochoidea, Strain CCMP3099" /LENGTH=52 /DNA_ID=CAMNT_0002649407 /DNA_START=64 /DNA_END=218 /DNA_ORIENTATION=-
MASARRSLLLPMAIATLALCAALSACGTFVGGSAPPAAGASLRAAVQTQRAL